MTFDTFDSYNTDEAYKDKGTTAKGLVDAYKKDNPNGSADDFYAKLNKTWAQDKDGHVKNAVNEAFKAKEEVKEEPKAEEKTAPKVEEMTQTTEALKPEEPKKEEKSEGYTSPLENEDTGISKGDETYMNSVNAILNEEQKKELQKLAKTSADDYNRTMENMERSGDAFKKIDDKLIEQLPTFMFKRFQNGEFGDPKSGDAKLRLAYFAMNNVVSKLKKLYNADSIVRGQGPIFSDTESAYDKYQQTNLEQGLQNRWNKYKAETDSAIEMVKNRNMSEEDALNIINKISMNNRLQNAFNMADANKKAYMIEVLSKVGDKVSNWNDQKFINTLIGAEATGEDVGNAAVLIGARAGGKILDNFNLVDENGNIDLSALKSALNIPGFADKFKTQFGFDPNNLLEGGESNPDSIIDEKKTNSKISNPTGNLKGYKALDGKSYDFNTFEGKEGKEKLINLVNDLDNRFYNGEIDAATYRKYREPLYKEIGKHRGVTASTTDEALKANVKKKLKDLNTATKNGSVTVDAYKTQSAKILEMAKDAGMSEKDIESLKKDFKKESSIKYKGPKE
jgi:hypothetical protein